MLTGGEPLLYPETVKHLAERIKKQTSAPVVVYTAMPERVLDVLPFVDGVTLTLHDQDDVAPFMDLDTAALQHAAVGKLMRLNVFNGVTLYAAPSACWEVKANITWIKDCPLPCDEEFKRLAGF